MAAVPSVVNLINNHLSTMDKEKDRESVVPEAYNDEDNLVGKNGAYLIFGIDGYVQIYKKFWPFRFLKMTNFVLLLLLAIGTSVTYSYSIWWSNYGESILYERPFRIYESYAISLWILFLFSFCSLIVHRFAKSTFFAGDICFYAINIVILCFSNILFSTKSVAEFLWFWPKLANFNYTFEGYVDLTESNEDYKQSQLPYYQPHYYFDSDNNVWPNGIKDQVDRRKKELLLNLLINPTSAVLSGIAIIINILMIFILYKRMRKSNLFASGLNNYKLLFPNCSEIEQKYSNHYPFGMIKTFLWLSPTILIFGILCFPPLNNSSIKPYILPSIIYFIHWLLYYCTIHLNKDVKRIDFICLKNLFYLDLFISLFFAILFITRYISERYFESKLFLLASILYGSYFLILSFIYWKNIDRESFKSFNFEFPVSIKINIEINRKPITDDKKDNENEKIVEVKDDEKEKNNEVKV